MVDIPKYEFIRYDVVDGVARLRQNRPDALNAWTPELAYELVDALKLARSDESVRAVLISGEGRAFGSGADLKSHRDTLPSGEPDLSGRLREVYNRVIIAVRSLPKPVVAAVQGACAGISASFALSADFILAAEDAYFMLAFVRIGLIPDGGSAAFLVERIGLTRTTQLAMTGEKLPAERAHEWGVVNSVHPVSELDAAADELAARLATGPTVALGNIKHALNSVAQRGLADHLELEATLQQQQAGTQDFAEGISAFLEKRPTRFQGR